MNKYIIYSTLLLLLLSTSCFKEPKKKLQNTLENTSVKETIKNEIIVKKDSIEREKFILPPKEERIMFCYVKINIIKPLIDTHNNSEPSDYCSITYETEIYNTKIVEILNYNEDEKYKMIDEVEELLRKKLAFRETNNFSEAFLKCKDKDFVTEFKNAKYQIEKTQFYKFTSYSEASKHKNN